MLDLLKRRMPVAILIASSLVVGITNAYASPITVATDRPQYQLGEIVMISGNVGQIQDPNLPLLIQVFRPDGQAFRFDQVIPEPDGSYSYSFVIGGPLAILGPYTVRVVYSGESAETVFLLQQPPVASVGGEILGIDMTSLIVAGAFANAGWIIPIAGLFVGGILTVIITKRFSHNRFKR